MYWSVVMLQIQKIILFKYIPMPMIILYSNSCVAAYIIFARTTLYTYFETKFQLYPIYCAYLGYTLMLTYIYITARLNSILYGHCRSGKYRCAFQNIFVFLKRDDIYIYKYYTLHHT